MKESKVKTPQHFILAHLKIHWETFVAFYVNSVLFLFRLFPLLFLSVFLSDKEKGIDVCMERKIIRQRNTEKVKWQNKKLQKEKAIPFPPPEKFKEA